MSRLGYDRETGFVYEGRGDPSYPTWPTPVLSQATLIAGADDYRKIPVSMDSFPFTWIFREDFFDPVSRVRRGRLFEPFGGGGSGNVLVECHPAIKSDMARILGGTMRLNKELSVFIECTELLQLPNRGEGARLAMGSQRAFSVWRIIQAEHTASNDVMVTLRAESAFGILPELDTSRIAPDSLPLVRAALARVLDAAYKELPTSVVDQCRNAATVIVSQWMRQVTAIETQKERDLGGWITAIRAHFGDKEKSALRSALEVIRVLHPRGKDNEVVNLGLRPVVEGDAEYAVHAIGFVLREVGWAR